MNVFIAGGGRVGFHLARLLVSEGHGVTVLESDTNRLEQIDYALDVQTVQGSAADILTLKSANAGDADLFFAGTGSDEVNIIAAAAAKGLGAKQVVARVHQRMYSEADILYETIMGIDYLLSPQALTAHEIANFIENPGMITTETFGRGLVQMRQMRVSKSPLGNGQTLADIHLPQGVLIGLISRNGSVEIAHGDSTLKSNDIVTIVGQKDAMGEIDTLFQGEEIRHDKIVIIGGASIGLHLAQVLENHGKSVKLFDYRMEVCERLAAQLKKTKVICRDGTSRSALEQEHIGVADMFVATTGDDERNIMACVLAKEVGAKQTLAVVHQPDFAPLVSKLGIDHAVTPRVAIANRILKLVNADRVTSLAVLEEGQIEVIESDVPPESPLAGRPLAEVRLPKDCLIATVLRDDQVIVPHGEDIIRPKDSVVLITSKKRAEETIRKFFRP